MQQVLRLKLKNFKTFINYTKGYFRRNDPLKNLIKSLEAGLKDVFQINKKRKMVKMRLKYQMHQLNQMERLIAQNNEHTFLRGNKFNEMR